MDKLFLIFCDVLWYDVNLNLLMYIFYIELKINVKYINIYVLIF